MGYGRARVTGLPDKVYILVYANTYEGDTKYTHKLYSSLGAAKGVMTREKRYRNTKLTLYAVSLDGAGWALVDES